MIVTQIRYECQKFLRRNYLQKGMEMSFFKRKSHAGSKGRIREQEK
jgi:hypothetical protein